MVPSLPEDSTKEDSPGLSERTPSHRRIAEAAPPASSDIKALLDLVSPGDQFGTNRNLGKALEKFDASALLGSLNDLEASSKDDPKFYQTRTQIFNHLALADPSLAFETLMSGDDKNFRHSQIGNVIRYLAKENFSAARAAVESIADKTLLSIAQSTLLNSAIEYAPQSIPELLAETKQVNAYQYSMNIGSWQSHGFDNWGHQAYYPTVNQNSVISQWAVKDLAAAEAYARGIEESGARASALAQIAAVRSKKDPEGALAWAESLTDTKERQQAMTSALQAMAAKDPHRVAGMLDSLTDPNIKRSLISTVAHSLLASDRAAGLAWIAWIDTLPTGSTKSQALSSAIQQIAQEDPRSAVALLDKLPPNARKQNLNQLAQAWAQKDLKGAKAWITSIQNPFELQTGLGGILGP